MFVMFLFVCGHNFYACEKSKTIDEKEILDVSSLTIRDQKIYKIPVALDFESAEGYEEAIESLIASDLGGNYLNTIRREDFSCRFDQDRQSLVLVKKLATPYQDSLCSNMVYRFTVDDDCSKHHAFYLSFFLRYAYASYLLQPKSQVGSRVFAGDFRSGIQTLEEERAARKKDMESRSVSIEVMDERGYELTHVLIEAYGRKESLRRLAPRSTQYRPQNVLRKLQNRSLGIKPIIANSVRRELKSSKS